MSNKPGRNDALTDRLSRFREINIKVTGRKSGRAISIPVWFVFDDEKLHLLPVHGSDTQWYKSFKLDLDSRKIGELVLKVFPRGVPPVQERSAVYVAPLDWSVLNAATRLMDCLAQPGDVELLAPLVVDEILIRLLRSPIGLRVAQMGFAESSVHRVAKAISWLRDNFHQPMKVEELAELVHMSVSSFHEHFKTVTSMSPLQYQKSAAASGGQAPHVIHDDGRGLGKSACGLSQ